MIEGTVKYVKASSAADDVNEAIEKTATADDLQDRLEYLRSWHSDFDFSIAEQVLQNRRDEEMPLRLFHGTSRDAAEAIRNSAFKPSPSDENNPEELGKGVYVVVAVHDIRGTACPRGKWCPFQCVKSSPLCTGRKP